ncbi:MAG TPA: hypothetical protein VJ385_06085 [Fibrobacteria bacterium]|nr:hypothetical protein [Fibrobacteria bacterium]
MQLTFRRLTFHRLPFLILPALAGCSRDFDSPYLPSSSGYAGSAWSLDGDGDGVADSVEKYAPGCRNGPQACLDRARTIAGAVPVDTGGTGSGNAILVESISAPDLRLTVGETRQAQVKMLPENATSRNYEMSSQNGDVAVVRPGGIFAVGTGSTFIAMHALDGSDKEGRFKVTVVSADSKGSKVRVELPL